MCAQSCSSLCGLVDCSLPGSSVYGIFQARKEDAIGFTVSHVPICGFWFGSWVEKDQWLHNFSITTLTLTLTNRMVLWVITVSWRRKWQPTPVFLPGKSYGQGSLVGYSPWGRKRVGHELATTTYCLTQWLPQFTFPPTANAQS